MSEDVIVVMKQEIAKAIELNVNGGIRKIHEILEHQNEKQDEFNKKVDAHIVVVNAHMAKVEPYLQSAAGLGILWKGVIALAVGWIAIKNGFTNLL